MSDNIDIENLVEVYRKIRDAIAQRKEAFEAELEELDKSLSVV
jgi:hypothetical protein